MIQNIDNDPHRIDFLDVFPGSTKIYESELQFILELRNNEWFPFILILAICWFDILRIKK